MGISMIATWPFSMAGVAAARASLIKGGTLPDALSEAICMVEDEPTSEYVGYGGLPNRYCNVELDAAYMDGDSLLFGAIMGVHNVKNPIKVALELSKNRVNCQLVGRGAEMYAEKNGFEFCNMLTEPSKNRWETEIAKFTDNSVFEPSGHDTVGMVGLDAAGHMGVGVSTSGLFMKHPGRVGDSPIIGSGFYCDSAAGGAAATGKGEDIMKGCLCYEIVRLMADGMHPHDACNRAMRGLEDMLIRRNYGKETLSMSVVALDKHGRFGAASTIDIFEFVAFTDGGEPLHYTATLRDGRHVIEPTAKG